MSVKNTRKIDSLRRITIPKIYCDSLDIRTGDSLIFTQSDNHLIVTKERISCSLCESEEFVRAYKKGFLCRRCQRELEKTTSAIDRQKK